MTIDSICYKVLKSDGGLGLYARMDGKGDTKSFITPMTNVDASWLMATLVFDIATRSKKTVREVLKDISQAAYLVEANKSKVEYRNLTENANDHKKS